MLESLGYEQAGEPRRGRPDPLQHLLDPRVGRQPLHRPPGRGEAAEVRRPRARGRRRRLLGAVGQGRGLPSASPSSTSPSAPARSTSWPSSSTPTRSAPRATSSSRTSPATCRPAASATSRAGCRSRRAATAAAPTASSPRPGGARSAATRASCCAEAEALAADGVREVTLLGQNVNSYGRDLPRESRIGFSELLARVDAVEGIERIRYTSPHPKDMKEDVIRAHAELPALCEHIHLPLQSGSSAVLKRMRRTYDRGRYMDRVALIREHVPDCAITTDIIVGFPGETDADFEQTLEVVDEVGYDGAFTFVFSPRRETEAATIGRPAPAPGQGRADGTARRAGPAPRRASAPSGSSAARWRCWSRGRAAPTRPACADARGTTRRSTSRGRRQPGELVDGRDRRGHLDRRCSAAERLLVARRPREGPRHIRADRGRQDRRRDRACGPAARARGGPGGDLLRRAAGLRGPRDADRRRERRASRRRLEHRLVGFVPVDRAVLGRRLHASWRTRRSTRRWRRGGGRSSSAAPASTCGRAIAELLAGQGARRRSRRTPSSGRPRSRASPDDDLVGLDDMDRDRAAATSGSTPAPRRSPTGSGAASRRCGARGGEARAARGTARKALGFDELLGGDLERMKKRSRNYARRQLTWMRKIAGRPARSTARATRRRGRAADARRARRIGCRPMRFEKWQALGNDYLIVEAEALPWELTAAAGPAALRPAFRGRLRRHPAARRAARTRSSSPSCGSSTRTAPRPSCRATAPARRSSTCAATAGPTRRPSRSTPSPGRSCRRSPRSDLRGRDGAGIDRRRRTFPSGAPDGTGTLIAGGRDWDFQHVSIGNPQCAIEVGEELEELDLAGDRPRDRSATSCSRTAPTSPSSASTAAGCGRGSSSAGWGRRSPPGPAPAAPRSPPSCAARRARSRSSSTAASSRSRSPTTSTCA